MSQPTPPPFAPATQPAVPTSSSGQPSPPSENEPYQQNNPFFIAVDGIKALLQYARPAAIILIALSLLAVTFNIYSNLTSSAPTNEPTTSQTEELSLDSLGINTPEDIGAMIGIGSFIGIIVLMIIVFTLAVGALLQGIGDVAAAAAINKKTLTLGQTFSTLFRRFPGYLWLVFLVAIRVLLWSLLFIIPGIIMAVRYSLAGVAFFAKDMKATEAIRHSAHITKGGWTTLFASDVLFNIVTLGTLHLLTRAGVRAVIFEQYHRLSSTGTVKPATHWLSILTVVLYFVLIAISLAILLLVLGWAYYAVLTI